jgi:polyferredoxin
MRIIERATDPRFQVRIWTIFTAMWVVLTPVTMLTVLSSSVPWLEFMSLFANAASCATALVAALAYVRAASADAKADHVIEHHGMPEYKPSAN